MIYTLTLKLATTEEEIPVEKNILKIKTMSYEDNEVNQDELKMVEEAFKSQIGSGLISLVTKKGVYYEK